MWKNHLKIALRNLQRNKSYASINIVGLAVGLASFLLVALYVQHELSYDRFHEKKDRIYRVDEVEDDQPEGSPYLEIETAPELVVTIPEVQEAVRILRGPNTLRYESEPVRNLDGLYVDRGFFDVFSFDVTETVPSSALGEPNTVVLTTQLAQTMFGDDEPLGKTVTARISGQEVPLVVRGVVDVPRNSHFTFDFLLSLQTYRGVVGDGDFSAREAWAYVLLSDGADASEMEDQLQQVAEVFAYNGPNYRLELRPLSDLYFHYWTPNTGNVAYVYILSAIAIIILLIACANYVNLAMARSAGRTQEIGVRKVVGAYRSQLASQFMAESLLFAFIALPITLGLVKLAIPLFNDLADTHLALILHENAVFVLVMIGGAGMAGLLAGSYPALFLSRFQPVDILRGRLQASLSSAGLRRALIVFQFAASVALISCTAVILQQLDYVQEKDLGFNEEQVVSLPMGGKVLQQNKQAIRQSLLQHPGVLEFSASSATPGDVGARATFAPDPEQPDRKVTVYDVNADADYLEALGMKLAAGRFFSAGRASDSTEAVVLNEAAVREMGGASPEEAVGKHFRVMGNDGTVIGVVEDFHFQSLHQEVKPMIIRMQSWGLPFPPYNEAVVRISGEDVPATMDFLRAQWEQFVPERPFTYTFLDERFQAMYRSEQQTATVFGIFAGLAVLLACLGLFGLVAYAAERRTKEIGIRKVFGASTRNIVALLSKDFAWLVLVAFVVAVPVAYYAMSRWLEDFAYRIELGPWVFVGAGLLALVIAMATVSYQAIRTALTNPADTLRYE